MENLNNDGESEVAPDATEPLSSIPETVAKIETPAAPARKLAGKYDSIEDLEAGYAEAQKVISSRTVQTFEGLSEKIGGPIEEVVVTYLKDGKLSAAQNAAFKQAGIGEDLAQRIVEGEANRIRVAQYQVDAVKAEVAAVAGGKAQQDQILNWASQTLMKSEIDSLNARLNQPESAVSAMRELTFMHQKALGTGGARPLVEGLTPPASAPGYGSVDEVVNAMRFVRKQGYIDESTKRRLSNTPQHFIQGMNQ